MNVQCSHRIGLLQRYFYDFLIASITSFIPMLLHSENSFIHAKKAYFAVLLLASFTSLITCFTYTYTANGKRQIQV